MIHVDQADTPAIKIQRNGRVRRASSQYQTVFVHDLITEHSRDVERLENIKRATNIVDGIVSTNEAQAKVLKELSK